jgi:hypothetical protein
MTKWLSSECIGGFVSGVIATLIGFCFTMLWEIYKQHRAEERRRVSSTLRHPA